MIIHTHIIHILCITIHGKYTLKIKINNYQHTNKHLTIQNSNKYTITHKTQTSGVTEWRLKGSAPTFSDLLMALTVNWYC